MAKFNKLWIIPPVVLAVILLMVLPKFKQPPKTQEQVEKAIPVKVIKTIRLPFSPKITAFGMTQPAKTWQAIAEVTGSVSWMSENMKEGNIIAKGTHILTLDDKIYQLNLKEKFSQIKLLEVKVRTTKNALSIEQKRYQSLKKEVDRKQKLLMQGAVTQSEFDEAQRNLLNMELVIQNHKNTLELQQSEIELLEVQKELAELDIANTKIFTPMDVRITELKINLNQFVNKGQMLLSSDGIEEVEIEARIPIGKLRPLLVSKNNDMTGVDVTQRAPGAKRLKAKVRLKTATHAIEWPAKVDRVSGIIDPETQTIGVVVVVDKPYKKAQPGKRPPLIRNTLVEIELQKQGQDESVIIPQSALRQGKVYLLDSENRLKIVKVKAMFKQGNLTIISKGLDKDEMIIISKLSPAIEGMLLDPIKDKKAMKRLKMEATDQKMKKGRSQ